MAAALLFLLEHSHLQVGECRNGGCTVSPGPKLAAAASLPTRMIRSETPLGWSRARVSVHCQALRPLGFTKGVDGALGVALWPDAGMVQKACSPV